MLTDYRVEANRERVSAAVDALQEVVAPEGIELALVAPAAQAKERQIELAVAGNHVRAELLVDLERDVIVATEFQAAQLGEAQPLLEACERLGRHIECGSVFVTPRPVLEAEADWSQAGFRNNYVRRLRPVDGSDRPPDSRPEYLDRAALDATCAALQRVVGLELEWGIAYQERPYIVSLDFSSDLNAGENAEFHCFVHFHELSRGCYIEKVVVPADRRRRGIGTRVFGIVRRFAERSGCRHVYLVAKEEAEVFWRRQGFVPVPRANIRSAQRRVASLRKQPGWEVARVGADRLEQPVWHYRNHPQDDLDLAWGMRLLNLA